MFRPTEAALGLAASELFNALPETYRIELLELPSMITVLEARAAEARSEMDVVAAPARDPTNQPYLKEDANEHPQVWQRVSARSNE